MLSKDPAPENLEEGAEDDDGEISEKTAGPSFKEEEEPEEESADTDEDEDGLTERRARRMEEQEEEDNTLSLAQMEETLKSLALEKFATITDIFRTFSTAQDSRMPHLATRHIRRQTQWAANTERTEP